MRKLALALLFVFVISGAVLAGTLTPDLIAKLNSSPNTELIPVNVTMIQQGDQELMQNMTAGLDKHATRQMVVQYLQDLAQSTQTEVVSYLNSLKGSGKVDRIMPLFIVNMVSVRATADVIQRLPQLANVDAVNYDPERYQLAAEVPTGPVAPGPGSNDIDEIAWGVAAVNAPAVWALGFHGEGVLVGMLDTGVNYNHLDLTTHMWNGGPNYPHHGWDFYNNDNDPIDQGPLGHGSHTAGTVASNGTAGTQAGVAPNATIMAIEVWSGGGNGSTAQMIAGINFGIAQNCDIISMSGGTPQSSVTISDKQQFRTACENALAAGLIYTVAAGNENGQYAPPNACRVPGGCPPPWPSPYQTLTGGLSAVVCCGATDNTVPPTIANFSSHGPYTWQGISPWNDYPYNPGMGLLRPDVCAPGVNVKSCLWNNNSGYQLMSGTSMATPHVAGVIALMLSKNHNLTPRQIDSLLETSSQDLGTAGKDNIFGAGFTNALAAVNAVWPPVPPVLNVTLTPIGSTVIPSTGGQLNFTAAVINAGPAMPFVVWGRIKNPDGSYTAPTLGPITISPPINVNVSRNRVQNVPAGWAAGTYYYLAYGGLAVHYPAIDADSFMFTKSADLSNGPIVWDATCTGELFPGEVAQVTNAAPSTFSLAGAYPNPFNPTTTIRFTLPEAAKVVLNVFDVSGRQVAQLVNGVREAGEHQVTFDGSNLASGVYLYTLATGSHSVTGKMVLMK